MVLNVLENGPNDASNTNTKLPDLKWQKMAKKIPKMAKMTLKLPKIIKNGQNYVRNCFFSFRDPYYF